MCLINVECDYLNYNPENMNNEIQNIDLKLFYNTLNLNEAVKIFNSTINTIFEKHALRSFIKVRGKPYPWLNDELLEQMNRRYYILKKARRTKNDINWTKYKLKCMQ